MSTSVFDYREHLIPGTAFYIPSTRYNFHPLERISMTCIGFAIPGYFAILHSNLEFPTQHGRKDVRKYVHHERTFLVLFLCSTQFYFIRSIALGGLAPNGRFASSPLFFSPLVDATCPGWSIFHKISNCKFQISFFLFFSLLRLNIVCRISAFSGDSNQRRKRAEVKHESLNSFLESFQL